MGARVRLRPPESADAAAVYEFARDSEFLRYVSTVPEATRAEYTIQDTEAHLQELAEYNRAGAPGWIIELAGAVVGIMRTRPATTADGGQAFEIGYSIAATHQNQGLATEALGVVQLHWAEAFQGIPLEAFCHPDNLASRRVLLRCGFRGPQNCSDGRMRYNWAASSPLPTLL